jgi:SAM-dependent methyltransferase
MEDLFDIDWREAWVKMDGTREAPCDSAYWDGRAAEPSLFADSPSYVDTFVEYLGLKAQSSLLDVGCGTGALARPLARRGHHVIAVDFSQGMLDAAARLAADEGLCGIEFVKLDFNDLWERWQAAGVRPKSVDVAIASRSTMIHDFAAACEKLEQVARSHVAITVSTEYGPRGFRGLGSDGQKGGHGALPYVPNHILALNILLAQGRFPELRYIDSMKKGADGSLRRVRWAFIKWDVPSQI